MWQELEERIKEAQKEGLSVGGVEKLKVMLLEFKDIFKIRLRTGSTAKIAPLKIDLKTSMKKRK